MKHVGLNMMKSLKNASLGGIHARFSLCARSSQIPLILMATMMRVP